jgi:cobalt-zinc-cadmium efflux system membrane fusion protein
MDAVFAAALTVLCVGCEKSSTEPAAPDVQVVESDGHVHGAWWCDEHGVPEEICARCDSSLVAEFKAKKDWCNEHDRPDSQCFICHPEFEATFAKLYEAKYDKQPPKPSDEDKHDHGHDHDHKHSSEEKS